ncbi:MAG: hypothetical protein J6Y02_17600 [Pseudobutyrivibrio sp.]|nr:hypothetical protein [Pseudobutyrivibrio sp.]
MNTVKMLVPVCESIESKVDRAILIPEGATNGDVIKAMFPKVTIIVNENLGEKGTVFVIFKNHETVILFDLDWWNAPYKKSEG